MHVIFIHGAPASGKHTIGRRLSELTGLPLFHNHLAVDVAKSLFAFGTRPFSRLRATIWRTAFAEAMASGTSFIFTFNPESTVEPALIEELCRIVGQGKGRIYFVQLVCSRETVVRRMANESRTRFGKLVDPGVYLELEARGAFAFPPLPEATVVVDTDALSAELAAEKIAREIARAENDT